MQERIYVSGPKFALLFSLEYNSLFLGADQDA